MKNIQKKLYYLLKTTKIKESPVSDILQHIISLFLNILKKVICKDDVYNGFQGVRKDIVNQGWNFSFSRTLLPSCSYNTLLCFSCHRWRGFSQGRGALQHCYTTLAFLKCCSCPLEMWITPRDYTFLQATLNIDVVSCILKSHIRTHGSHIARALTQGYKAWYTRHVTCSLDAEKCLCLGKLYFLLFLSFFPQIICSALMF